MGAIILTPVALGLWIIRVVAGNCTTRKHGPPTEGFQSGARSTDDGLREFPYRPNRILVVSLFLLCLGGEVLFCYFAYEKHDILMAAGAALGPVGLVAIGMLVVSAFVHESRVGFTEDDLIVPKPHWTGLSSDEIRIAFRDIVAVTVSRWGPVSEASAWQVLLGQNDVSLHEGFLCCNNPAPRIVGQI